MYIYIYTIIQYTYTTIYICTYTIIHIHIYHYTYTIYTCTYTYIPLYNIHIPLYNIHIYHYTYIYIYHHKIYIYIMQYTNIYMYIWESCLLSIACRGGWGARWGGDGGESQSCLHVRRIKCRSLDDKERLAALFTRRVLQVGDVALCRVGMMTGKETVAPIETPTAIPTKTCHDKIWTLKVANVTA